MAVVKSKRKTLTPEQLAASQARRETIRKLAKHIQAMSIEERFAIMLKAGLRTCEGHELSPFNACLVLSQQSDATIVGGFRQWKQKGRQVRKGARGCAIFVPKWKESEDGGIPDEKHFLMITVFDITMTDALETL